MKVYKVLCLFFIGFVFYYLMLCVYCINKKKCMYVNVMFMINFYIEINIKMIYLILKFNV